MKTIRTQADNGSGQSTHQVATGSNRISSQGNTQILTTGQTSRVIATSISAGQTIPFAIAGTSFYVSASSAAIMVRPSGGEFTSYVQGTGLQILNGFDSLEINNPGSSPVSFQIFVGFDTFLDRRLFLAQSNTPNVAFPTYSTPMTAPAVAITDLSGQGFFDLDGNPWLAIQRLYIVISNVDASATVLVQKQGTVTQNGPAIAAVFPNTSWIEALSGNFALNVGGGNVNCIVHEIYQSIPPSGLSI